MPRKKVAPTIRAWVDSAEVAAQRQTTPSSPGESCQRDQPRAASRWRQAGLITITDRIWRWITLATDLPPENGVNGTQVLMAGLSHADCRSASSGQINAIVRTDVRSNDTAPDDRPARHQLLGSEARQYLPLRSPPFSPRMGRARRGASGGANRWHAVHVGADNRGRGRPIVISCRRA